MVEFSPEGIITNVNQNLCDLFELDSSAFVGKHLSVFIGDEVFQQLMRHLSNGRLFENIQNVSVGGNELNMKQKFLPICDPDEQLQSCMLLSFHDQEEELRKNMEAMKTQEEEIRQSMEEIQATLEEGRRKDFEIQQFHDAIFATNNVVELDADAVITDANPNFCSLFELTRSAFIGKHITTLIDQQEFSDAWSNLSQGKIFEEVHVVTSGTKKIPIRHKFIPINDEKGVLAKVMLFAIPE